MTTQSTGTPPSAARAQPRAATRVGRARARRSPSDTLHAASRTANGSSRRRAANSRPVDTVLRFGADGYAPREPIPLENGLWRKPKRHPLRHRHRSRTRGRRSPGDRRPAEPKEEFGCDASRSGPQAPPSSAKSSDPVGHVGETGRYCLSDTFLRVPDNVSPIGLWTVGSTVRVIRREPPRLRMRPASRST
jgi:hypothetical protein